MKTTIFAGLIALLLLPGDALAQRPRQQQQMNRQQLEARVMQQFMNRAAQEMRLPAGRRDELARVTGETQTRRRELGRRAAELRRQLQAAATDESTSDAAIERMLGELDQLRVAELQLWRDEQAALARILTPRQRIMFIAFQARFNERIQQLRQQQNPNDLPF